MRRISSLPYWQLPALNLRRKDLDKTLVLLGGEDAKVRISADGYEYESLDELAQHAERRPRELELRSDDATLTISRDLLVGGSLHGSNTAEGAARYVAVREFLETRQRLIVWLSLRRPTAFIFLLATAVLAVQLGPELAMVPALPAIYLTVYAGGGYAHVVSLDPSASSFWQRKKDDVILLVVGAVLGAGATWIYSRLIGSGCP